MNFVELRTMFLLVKVIAQNSKSFKIGKTGQSLKDRYNQEYSKDYSKIEEVYFSEIKDTINNFEELLIIEFQTYHNCDNHHASVGEMVESDTYILYVVYNPK